MYKGSRPSTASTSWRDSSVFPSPSPAPSPAPSDVDDDVALAEDDEFPVVDSADDVATADAAEDVVAAADSVAAVATADAAEDVAASGGDVVVAAADSPAASDDAVEEDEVDVVVEDEVDDVVVEDEVVDVVVEDVVVASAAAVVIGSCVVKKSSPSSQIIGVGVVVVLWPRPIALKPFRITSITHASWIGNSLQTERASNIS